MTIAYIIVGLLLVAGAVLVAKRRKNGDNRSVNGGGDKRPRPLE